MHQHAAELRAFRPRVNAGPSPFNLMDLRFLARTRLGLPVVVEPKLQAVLEGLDEPLRIALAAYMGTWFVSTYEDVVGLHLAGRDEQALLLAGELAQRACLAALLQMRLVDPSPKWAFEMARQPESEATTRVAAELLLTHLGQTGALLPNEWVARLLRLANGLVATAMLSSFSEAAEVAGACAVIASNAPPPVEVCLVGVPGRMVALDVVRNQLVLCNLAYLQHIRAAAHAVSQPQSPVVT